MLMKSVVFWVITRRRVYSFIHFCSVRFTSLKVVAAFQTYFSHYSHPAALEHIVTLYPPPLSSYWLLSHRTFPHPAILSSFFVTGFLSYLESLPVKMGPIRCPETSVHNYHPTPCNNPEDHRYQSLLLVFKL